MTAIPLRAALGEYLAVRRALGFKLTRDGLLLGQFVSFLEEAGATTVTTELALSWTTSPAKQSPSWLAMPLSAATYETLIGLLAVTGMRVGEAIRLDRADLLLDDGLLSVRDSKFDQSRMVPIHPSTVGVLRDYLERRRVLSPLPSEPSLFVHPAGNRVRYESVQAMFRALARRAGVEARSDRCRPTVHGLRHTFAVNTLVSWYREGADVQARLPQLSTFLGHADVKWTYWYLSASPELLSLAADRLEAATGGRR